MFSGSFNVMKSPFHDIIMEIPAQSAPPRPDIENTKRKQAGADFTTSACFSYMIKGKSTRGLLRCGIEGVTLQRILHAAETR